MSNRRVDYEACCERADHHAALQRSLLAHLPGWRVVKEYLAVEGSLYLRLERLSDGVLCRVRISEHEQISASHVAPDVNLIVDPDYEPATWAEVAQAIEDGRGTLTFPELA